METPEEINRNMLERLVIGKMKNYRLSDNYKEFISKVGHQYDSDYIERIDPNDEIKPITVVEKSYPIRHVYLDGTSFK
jgi:disulfide oxidoreductase YuzD